MAIKIDDLIPLLEPGWVAMDNNGDWYWYAHKPKIIYGQWCSDYASECLSIYAFNIRPVKDWETSLRKVA